MIEIWQYGKGWYKLYTDDPSILSKIIRWKKVEVDATYRYPDGSVGKCVIFPSSIYKRVTRKLSQIS